MKKIIEYTFIIIILFLISPIMAQSPKERMMLEQLITQSDNLLAVYPVKDLIVINGLKEYLPLQPPVKDRYWISSKYGYRYHPFTNKKTFHTGIDIACELATPVYATATGTVKYAGRKGGYGRCIILEHKYGYSTIYGHLSAYYCRTGDDVKQGSAIGFVGSTGRSTGNHLHYELRKNNRHINPIWYEY